MGADRAPFQDVAHKLLIPVLPSERFYDGVVAAGDLIAREGGTITFLFTKLRPPPEVVEQEDQGFDPALDPDVELAQEDVDALDAWRDEMVADLAEARDLLRERGIGDDQVTTRFADLDIPPARAIADEAAAGGFDLVVLPRGAMAGMPDLMEGGAPLEIAAAVQELADDGVRLMVT
jgi:hypothetical protein